jgi:ABC-2 type transport system permease protein
MKGFIAVIRKEAIHMRRDRGTLRLALGIPLFQLILFGSIDTNIKHVPTVVFDQCRCPESRALFDELVATRTFEIKRVVNTHEFARTIVSPGARGISSASFWRHRLREPRRRSSC